MSDTTFFVSAAAVRNLKHGASIRAQGVSSAHLTEAIAASLGFKSHAALRAAFKAAATVEVPKPSNALMIRRLHQLGHTNIPEHELLVPEFEHSYSPLRDLKLRKTRGPRWWTWRNLMVAAINAGLEQRLFGLGPDDTGGPADHPRISFASGTAINLSWTTICLR